MEPYDQFGDDKEKQPTSITAQLSSDHVQVAPLSRLSRNGLPLLPQPSDDPFDPLNWPATQKLGILAALVIWVYQGTCNMLNISPAFFLISEDLNCSLNVVTYLVGGPLLSYGVASVFWVAAGNRFGVRKCLVFSSLASGLLSIWGAKATSFASLTAARTLASAFMASPETLGPQVIADLFFLEDRARCMALFTLFQASGNALGPLQGAYITANLGWRWIQWVQVITSLSACVVLVLFLPETQYTRESASAHRQKRRQVDNFTFPRVSGGGKAKVDKYVLTHFATVQEPHADIFSPQLLACIHIPVPIYTTPCTACDDVQLLTHAHGDRVHFDNKHLYFLG